MTITTELEERVRERGVRVEERLALLRLLTENQDDRAEQVRLQIAALEQQIREAGAKVRGALR